MKKEIYADHSHMESVSVGKNPIAEVVEFDEAFVMFVNRVEKLFYIWDGDVVGLEDGLGFVEFGKR